MAAARLALAHVPFAALVAGLALALAACAAAPDAPAASAAPGAGPARPAPPPGLPPREAPGIVACGRAYPLARDDVRVVRWFEPPRYSAYSTAPRFGGAGANGLRYRPGRAVADPELQRRIDDRGPTLADLRRALDLVVLHYDACGTSRRCFEVLHDRRGLSCHFLLDVDGTIYQTLDLADQAWHATTANARSVGIEIANPGAWPPEASDVLERWYADSGDGAVLAVPADERRALRDPDFDARPARPFPIAGRVNGRDLLQYDLTPAQYESLVELVAALARLLPRVEIDAPRDARGRVRADALPPAELARFSGVLGHQHVQPEKVDPGPAFDWEGFLAGVRSRLAAGGAS